jgi:hypothetical protein
VETGNAKLARARCGGAMGQMNLAMKTIKKNLAGPDFFVDLVYYRGNITIIMKGD